MVGPYLRVCREHVLEPAKHVGEELLHAAPACLPRAWLEPLQLREPARPAVRESLVERGVEALAVREVALVGLGMAESLVERLAEEAFGRGGDEFVP